MTPCHVCGAEADYPAITTRDGTNPYCCEHGEALDLADCHHCGEVMLSDFGLECRSCEEWVCDDCRAEHEDGHEPVYLSARERADARYHDS